MPQSGEFVSAGGMDGWGRRGGPGVAGGDAEVGNAACAAGDAGGKHLPPSFVHLSWIWISFNHVGWQCLWICRG